MSSGFQQLELDDLSKKFPASSTPPGPSGDADLAPPLTHLEEARESTAASWAWATSAVLLAWSCALIFWPRILLFAIGQSQPSLTPLESFLTLQFGLLFAFSAVGLVVNIPSAVPVPARAEKEALARHPFLVHMVAFSLLSAFCAYNTTGAGSLPKSYSACMGLVGIWGLWVIIFAGPTLRSRKTGADKHTSAFIFGNKFSASEQKKRWRREQQRKGQGH